MAVGKYLKYAVGLFDDSTKSVDQLLRGDASGAAYANIKGAPGTLEAITFTCNAAADCITDLTSPATGEIYWASGFTSGKKRVRFTFHQQNGTGIPHALGALVSVNGTTEATYRTRFTTADNGPSATAYTSFKQRRFISTNSPVAELDLTSTSADVDDIAVGFILPTGTGADAVYVDVEVW